MSVGPSTLIEQTRKHINRLVEEIARLSEQDLAPIDYYSGFLQRVQGALAATAGAIWLLSPQGQLQLQFQSNMGHVGIDKSDAARQAHDELLRQAASKGQPVIMAPQSGETAGNGSRAGNPTDYAVLLAPILIEKQVAGLVEIWQEPNRNPQAQRGFLQFLVVAADLAAAYTRNQRLRQMSGQQQLWTQLEAFTRQIHGSLNPTEVAYLVANEGRRLVDCDRICVAERLGKRITVSAVSGSDVVEKRSNLVQLMRALFDQVLKWNEKLLYTGRRDDTLPPAVLKALDAYLAESNSKLLTVLPLRDEREKTPGTPCRSALMMECFAPALTPEQMVGRLEVVGRHVASALYNSLEHRRIPLRWIWLPLARLQEGLGGKTQATLAGIAAGIAAIVVAMVLVPYPLKMDAKGQLLPQTRAWIYPPVEGHVEDFKVDPGVDVLRDQSLVLMRDMNLEHKLINLNKEIDAAQRAIDAATARYSETVNQQELSNLSTEKQKQERIRDLKRQERDSLRDRTNSEESRPGYFWVKSPMDGTVLNFDFRENLTGKSVKPSDQLLRIGDKNGPWEIVLMVPTKHIGQVLQAFKDPRQVLDVDLLLRSAPTRTYKGKLARDTIGGEATPNRENSEEAEAVVPVRIRIEGADIAPADRLPRDLLLTGTEVHANIRCGNRAMGYSLFYGVWEFLYEKVVFFF